MATPNETDRYELLDAWIDEWLATSVHEDTLAPPADDELAGMAEAASEIRSHVTQGTLASLDTSAVVALPQRNLNAGTLVRIAAVVLLLAGVAVDVAIARSDRLASPIKPVQHPRQLGSCFGKLKAVETDGAQMPNWLLQTVMPNLRGDGDPCPSSIAWVSAPTETIAKLGDIGGGKPGGIGYAVEARGHFYGDPLTRSDPADQEWFFETAHGANGSAMTSSSVPIASIGTLHRLKLVPVPAQPTLPNAKNLEANLAELGDPSPTTPVHWVTLSVARALTIAPGFMAHVRAPGAQQVFVASIEGRFPKLYGKSGGRRVLTLIFLEAKGFTFGWLQGIKTSDVQLLDTTRDYTEWLAVKLPTRMPSWVTGAVDEQAKSAAHLSTAQWTVTTAGAVEAADPYQTQVQPGVPAVTPVWIVNITFRDKRLAGTVVISPANPGSRTPRIGAVGTFAGDVSGYDGYPLSHFGTVHSITLPG